MHLRVVTSQEAGGQQYPVAEQSAPNTLGPAVHWSLGVLRVADGDERLSVTGEAAWDSSGAWEVGLGAMLPKGKPVSCPQHSSRGR